MEQLSDFVEEFLQTPASAAVADSTTEILDLAREMARERMMKKTAERQLVTAREEISHLEKILEASPWYAAYSAAVARYEAAFREVTR